MLRSCLLLIGLPLLAVLGLLFFVGIEQTGDSGPILIEPVVPLPYDVPMITPLLPTPQPLFFTPTATAITPLGTPTATPTFGSPTAIPDFGATSTPFPNPT